MQDISDLNLVSYSVDYYSTLADNETQVASSTWDAFYNLPPAPDPLLLPPPLNKIELLQL